MYSQVEHAVPFIIMKWGTMQMGKSHMMWNTRLHIFYIALWHYTPILSFFFKGGGMIEEVCTYTPGHFDTPGAEV